MSRIGKQPVSLPKGVGVAVKKRQITVTGPKGKLEWEMPEGVTVAVAADAATVERVQDTARHRALHGLTRSLLKNMVTGVSEGYEKKLAVMGVGYNARVEGKRLIMNVGYCLPAELDIPQGIEVECPSRTNQIIVRGIDKHRLGQFCANIRKIRPPEPYKGKGIRYEDEKVRRKAGKSVVGGK